MSEPRALPLGVNPDLLEVAPGSAHEELQGWVPDLATPEETRVALEKAFNYRGDVTITLKDGVTVTGYLFDRRPAATLAESLVRIVPTDTTDKLSIPYSGIARLAFTGRDTAAGKGWEAWVRQYRKRKSAGERNIALDPDPL